MVEIKNFNPSSKTLWMLKCDCGKDDILIQIDWKKQKLWLVK